MPEYLQTIIILASGGLLCLIAVVVGAWVNHKGMAVGESFIGGPKGEVFTIPTGDEPEFAEDNKAEEHILNKSLNFLKSIGGTGV